MADNTQASTKKPSKKSKSNSYQIRGVPMDLRNRIDGVAGHLGLGKDEFVAELLRRDMERFEQHQDETKAWWGREWP